MEREQDCDFRARDHLGTDENLQQGQYPELPKGQVDVIDDHEDGHARVERHCSHSARQRLAAQVHVGGRLQHAHLALAQLSLSEIAQILWAALQRRTHPAG